MHLLDADLIRESIQNSRSLLLLCLVTLNAQPSMFCLFYISYDLIDNCIVHKLDIFTVVTHMSILYGHSS
jgi:hypothetical protein